MIVPQEIQFSVIVCFSKPCQDVGVFMVVSTTMGTTNATYILGSSWYLNIYIYLWIIALLLLLEDVLPENLPSRHNFNLKFLAFFHCKWILDLGTSKYRWQRSTDGCSQLFLVGTSHCLKHKCLCPFLCIALLSLEHFTVFFSGNLEPPPFFELCSSWIPPQLTLCLKCCNSECIESFFLDFWICVLTLQCTPWMLKIQKTAATTLAWIWVNGLRKNVSPFWALMWKCSNQLCLTESSSGCSRKAGELLVDREEGFFPP